MRIGKGIRIKEGKCRNSMIVKMMKEIRGKKMEMSKNSLKTKTNGRTRVRIRMQTSEAKVQMQ